MPDQTAPDLDSFRWDRARGALSARKREVLDRDEPGWYDAWEKADPRSEEALLRRVAICEPLVDASVCMLNHDHDSGMTFEETETKKRVEVYMEGTDDQMRGQVITALSKLRQAPGASFFRQ